MSQNPSPTGRPCWAARSLSEQATAFHTAADLADRFPGLPPAYLTVHDTKPVALGVQTETPADFEAWREALRIPAVAVELKTFQGSAWLSTATAFAGTAILLTGQGLILTAEQAEAPQAVAA